MDQYLGSDTCRGDAVYKIIKLHTHQIEYKFEPPCFYGQQILETLQYPHTRSWHIPSSKVGIKIPDPAGNLFRIAICKTGIYRPHIVADELDGKINKIILV